MVSNWRFMVPPGWHWSGAGVKQGWTAEGATSAPSLVDVVV
jgi:hypothetical protein